MAAVRDLAAQFLVVVGDNVVAVDRTQPVAATVSFTGEVRDVVSWADAIPPPSAAAWPNRRIGAEGDQVVVQDLPDGTPVVLSVGQDGSLAATPARGGGRDVRVHVAGFDDDPVIEVEFGLDTAPGKRFVRRDEPFDEFGNVAGLAFWNVIFDDEDFDLLAEGPVDDQGRVVV